jgi:RNA polymerase sigma-70 factor (ECF subfamily)
MKGETQLVAQMPQLRAIPGGKTDELSVSKDLESLYRAHHDRVFRLAYRVTGNLMDAEDVLQTVFLRLSRRETVDLEPNPASYLSRAAVNASLDLLRQRGRSPLVQMEDLSALPVGSGQLNPEATQARQELRETIRRAITHLGEKSAAMFVLKYFEGYGNQEIAELMGTSPMVVGVVLHRARARVRRELGDYIGNLTETANQEKEGDR